MKNSKGSKTQVLQQQLEAEIKARQQLEIALKKGNPIGEIYSTYLRLEW